MNPDLGAKGSDEFFNSPERIGNPPALTFEGKQGDYDGEQYEIDPGAPTTVGRLKNSKIKLTMDCVSRVHCNIKHDETYGWIVYENTDKPSTSGTWLHPKPYYKARVSIENSPPVVLQKGMIIKAHSYTF